MNRTGLAIALAIAFVVGVLFAVDPQLDLDLSRAFFNPATSICSSSMRSFGCSMRARRRA